MVFMYVLCKYLWYLYNTNILEYTEIVVTDANSSILDIEGHSSIYIRMSYIALLGNLIRDAVSGRNQANAWLFPEAVRCFSVTLAK